MRRRRFAFLKYDPLIIFRNSRTPAALYARQKWMGQGESERWRSDFHATVKTLFSRQKRNGSWQDDQLVTIRRLFGLHLTVREKTDRIEKAMGWLIAQNSRRAETEETAVSWQNLRDLPFSPCSRDLLVESAVLFLATIFGYAYDRRIGARYERLIEWAKRTARKGYPWSCMNTVMRACVVHPTYGRCKTVRSFTEMVAKVQRDDGSLPGEMPFFQTVNLLGHIVFPESDAIIKKAFLRLRETQNTDGTWGTTQKEWNTFLVVHALERKEAILHKV